MNRSRILRLVLYSSLLLFFLQALRVVLSVMFGVIYDGVFVGPMGPWMIASNLLLFLAMLAPLAAPRRSAPKLEAVIVSAVGVARIALSLNDASVRFWGSWVVITLGGVLLVPLLSRDRQLAGQSLLGALALDLLLRIGGDTYDLSLRAAWLPVQVLWAIMVIVMVWWTTREERTEYEARPGFGREVGLGLGALLFLETSLLGLPNAVARWSNTSYTLLAPALLGMTLLPMTASYRARVIRAASGRPLSRIALGSALVLGVALGYFTTGPVAAIAMVLAQLAALTLMLHLLHVSSRTSGPSRVGLAAGLLLFLILNFLNAFAFTYPYTLPAMRGMGWAVYLLAALALGLCGAMSKGPPRETEPAWNWPSGAALAALFALALTIFSVWPLPARSISGEGPLRLATYNIHYGYDETWHFTLDDMADAIAQADVDAIALQEVDAGRLTSYAVDDALFLARRLRMNALYVPTVEHLTGIAILYRGRALEVDWQWLTSLQEQTAIGHVRLDVTGSPVHFFGLWLGLSNEDTQRQMQEALGFIGDRGPAGFGGDFNAEPGSAVLEAVMEAGFTDPFLALGIDPPPTDPAVNPTKRIDYVWIRGLPPRGAWVSASQASDHRMVVVEVERAP